MPDTMVFSPKEAFISHACVYSGLAGLAWLAPGYFGEFMPEATTVSWLQRQLVGSGVTMRYASTSQDCEYQTYLIDIATCTVDTIMALPA